MVEDIGGRGGGGLEGGIEGMIKCSWGIMGFRV